MKCSRKVRKEIREIRDLVRAYVNGTKTDNPVWWMEGWILGRLTGLVLNTKPKKKKRAKRTLVSIQKEGNVANNH